MDILNDILRLSFLKFLWIGSIAGILVGAAMLFKPQQLVQLNQYFSRWVGSGKWTEVMDRPRWIERFMYRHHRWVGAGVLSGALVVLYIFLIKYNQRKISALIPHDYWWLSDALINMLLVGCGFAALIGSVVLIRPSLLRDFERSVNHWISTERLLSSLNTLHKSAEQSLLRHNRLAGVSILMGSFYVLVVLGFFLFSWKLKL